MKTQNKKIKFGFSLLVLLLVSCIWESPLLPESELYAGYTVVDNLNDMVMATPSSGAILTTPPESIIVSKNINSTLYRFEGASDENFSQLLWDSSQDNNSISKSMCCFQSGSHYVRIQVYDGENWSEWKNLGAFRIDLSESENPPTAEFTVIQKDLQIKCDAEASTQVYQYRWDFNCDGVYEQEWSDSPTAEHTYTSEGTYTVVLQVKSITGISDKSERPVTVSVPTESEQDSTPKAPSGLKAVEAEGGINLSWNDNSLNENGFILEAKVSGGDFTAFGDTFSANTTSYFHNADSGKTYTYRVKAVNAAGSSAYSDTVDRKWQSPVLSGLSSSTDPVKSVTWEWTCDDAEAEFRYIINQSQSAPEDWSSASWVTDKSTSLAKGDGSFYLHIQSKDKAGNLSETVSVSVVLDNTAPVFKNLANIDTVSQTLSWDWSADDFSSIEYHYQLTASDSVDENAWSAWSSVSGTSISGGDGRRYLHVKARDSLGNISAVSTVSGVLDNTAPGVVTLSGVTPTNDATPEWSWSVVAGASRYRYSLDSGSWLETTNISYSPFSSLTNGSHTLAVMAGDAAGNWSEAVSFAISVNTDMPDSPAVTAVTPTNNTTPQWTWSAVNGAAAYRYGYSEGNWIVSETTDLSFTPASSLAEGNHSLYVQARSSNGTWSLSGSFAITVDTIPPAVPNISGSAITNSDPVWIWTVSGDAITQEYSYDQSNWISLPIGRTSYTGTGLMDDSYRFYLRFTDVAGNQSDGFFDTILDTTSPAVSAGSDIAWTNTSASTSGASGTDAVAVASVLWEKQPSSGTVNIDTPSNYNTSFEGLLGEEGSHTLRLTVTDTAGNTNYDDMIFNWDAKAPVPGASGGLSFASVTASSVNVNWTAAGDGISDTADLQYKVVASELNNISTVADASNTGTSTRILIQDWTSNIATAAASGLTIGTDYYFNVLVRDEVGNTAVYTSGFQKLTGTVSISYTVNEPWDETITFDKADGFTLTQGDTFNLTISETFDSYAWELEGLDLSGETGSSVSVNTSTLDYGIHYLTAYVVNNGQSFSKSLRFSVIEGLAIGSIGPAGGWIFYDDELDGVDDIPGIRYLESAPADIAGTHVWGGFGTDVPGTLTAIDSGQVNTTVIVNAFGANEPYENRTDYAAKLADDYEVNGYSDWFLPSKDELNQMYIKLKVNDVGNFQDARYWSSSQYSSNYAWVQLFSNGSQYFSNQSVSRYVRVVRAF